MNIIVICKDDSLLRNVHPDFIIEEEGEIVHYAFRPRLHLNKDEDGVSVNIHKLFKNNEEIQESCFLGWSVYKILAQIPIECGYECKHTHKKHALITGDMQKLYKDETSLMQMASNAKFVLKREI